MGFLNNDDVVYGGLLTWNAITTFFSLLGHCYTPRTKFQAPEAVRIENDCIVLSLDDMYQVSFYLAPQKEEEGKGNNLTEDVTKEKDENDKMDIDDDIQLKIRRPLEGIARYAMLVLIYCGECSHLSPARLLADSLRFVSMFSPTPKYYILLLILFIIYGIFILLSFHC